MENPLSDFILSKNWFEKFKKRFTIYSRNFKENLHRLIIKLPGRIQRKIQNVIEGKE